MDFLTAKPLSDTIYDTLFKAEKELIIISPYIQISGYLRENVFKQHLNKGKYTKKNLFTKNFAKGASRTGYKPLAKCMISL